MGNKEDKFSLLKYDDNVQNDNKSLSIESDSFKQNNICQEKKKDEQSNIEKKFKSVKINCMIEILSYFKTNKLYEITFFSKKFNDCLKLDIITYKLLQIHCGLEKLMNSFFEFIDFIIDSLKKKNEYKTIKRPNKKHCFTHTIQKDKNLSEDFVKNEFIIRELEKIKQNFKILINSSFIKDFDYFVNNFKSTLFRTLTFYNINDICNLILNQNKSDFDKKCLKLIKIIEDNIEESDLQKMRFKYDFID